MFGAGGGVTTPTSPPRTMMAVASALNRTPTRKAPTLVAPTAPGLWPTLAANQAPGSTVEMARRLVALTPCRSSSNAEQEPARPPLDDGSMTRRVQLAPLG